MTPGADGVPGDATEVAAVTKQTTETLMAGERIIEAMDLADGERAALKVSTPSRRSPAVIGVARMAPMLRER